MLCINILPWYRYPYDASRDCIYIIIIIITPQQCVGAVPAERFSQSAAAVNIIRYIPKHIVIL